MAKILSIMEVGELNDALEQAGLAVHVHLHDVCGGQYLSWEPIGADESDAAAVANAIEGFLAPRGFKPVFDLERSSFRLAQ